VTEQSSVLGSPAEAALRSRRLVFAAVLMATFLAAMESTIVATAMPTIVGKLGGFTLFSWAFAAYLLTQSVMIPIYGRLADLYGRKRVFFAGTSLFLAASLLCGLAWGMLPLILFRALQGAGAGAIQPIATTIVGDIYRPEERAKIQGYVSGVFGVAAVFGPLAGALIVQHLNWSFVFWVNLPIGAFAFLMFGLFLHEERQPTPHRIDYAGSALMVIGIGAPMLALVEFGNAAGMATVAGLAGIGAAALALLVWHERGAAEPILPLRLWRNRVIAVGALGGFTGGAVMMSINAFLPLFVQGAMGRSPAAAGLALGAASVSWTFASLASGRLMLRTSYRMSAGVGAVTLVLGCAVLVLLDRAGSLFWPIVGSLLIGIGMGFCNTVFIVSTQAAVAWGQRGVATASIMFMRIAGSSVGAALFGAILNFGVERRVPGAGRLVNRLLEPSARRSLAAADLARLADAIAGAVHVLYLAAALVACLSLALALWLPSGLSPTRLSPRR
jgi:EmrB/QacA subfamily drug resistance transporter